MMGLAILTLCTFAFLVPIECVVVQLDNNNFDQVKDISLVRARPLFLEPHLSLLST